MPNRASLRQDSGPLSPVTSGSTASAGSRTPSRTSSLVTDARRDSLCLMSGRAEAVGVRRDHEAPDAFVRPAPHDGDVGDRAVGDPHLATVEHPVGPVPLGARGHAGRVGAVVGLGEAEAADRVAGRHPGQPLPASAPRCRASRWRTSPATPAPTPGCVRRCRAPRAPGRRCRSRRSSCRRSRSPRGACPAARARRSASPARAGRRAGPPRTTAARRERSRRTACAPTRGRSSRRRSAGRRCPRRPAGRCCMGHLRAQWGARVRLTPTRWCRAAWR